MSYGYPCLFVLLLLFSSSEKRQPAVAHEERIDLPALSSVADSTKLTCTALSTVTIAEPNGPAATDSSQRALVASIRPGEDKLAIRLEKDQMILLTRAAFESGTAEGGPFPIVQNTQQTLKAVSYDSWDLPSLETFVLNKRNGLAVWSMLYPGGPTTKGPPTSITIYFACH